MAWPTDPQQNAFNFPPAGLLLPHVHMKFSVNDAGMGGDNLVLAGATLTFNLPPPGTEGEVLPIGCVLVYVAANTWGATSMPEVVAIGDYTVGAYDALQPFTLQTTQPALLGDLRAIGIPDVDDWRFWWTKFLLYLSTNGGGPPGTNGDTNGI